MIQCLILGLVFTAIYLKTEEDREKLEAEATQAHLCKDEIDRRKLVFEIQDILIWYDLIKYISIGFYIVALLLLLLIAT